MIRACLFWRVLLARPGNAKQHCWSILTILTASQAAIGRVLSRPLPERRDRHNAMFQLLSHNDIQHWAGSFLTKLGREPSTPNQFEQMPFVVS
jgi:hypothetical protein